MVLRNRTLPPIGPKAKRIPVEERVIRRFSYLAAEPYPFTKVPIGPYYLPHGGHIDWLLAATGVGKMPTVKGLLHGEHTAWEMPTPKI